PEKINAMIDASKNSLGATVDSPLNRDPIAGEISFEDFAKVDLRVVKIVHAEHVEGADKLLKLVLSLGPDAGGHDVQRTVFSGIKSAYQPEELIGQLTVLVANLKPRNTKIDRTLGIVNAADADK